MQGEALPKSCGTVVKASPSLCFPIGLFELTPRFVAGLCLNDSLRLGRAF